MLRILLADHHPHILRAFEMLLREEQEIDLIGVAEDTESLLRLAETSPVDLFLVDWKLPGSPIEDLIDSLHALELRPFVIVMSSEIEYSRTALKAGADAYVSKSDEPNWLLETLHKFEYRRKDEKK